MRAWVFVLTTLTTLLLPLTFPDDGPNAVDRWTASHVDVGSRIANVFVEPTEAQILLPIIALGVGYFVWRRHARAAILLVVGPLLAIMVNGWVLKPLFSRDLHHYLAYPSGHTVSLVAVLTAFALVTAGRLQAVTVLAGVVVLPLVAIGMVELGYHHVTDVIGATTFGIAVLLATDFALRRTPVIS